MILRILAAIALVAVLVTGDREAAAQTASRPLRIYAITFRGMTDVERGFQDYFAARRIPVQITFRDLNRDMSRMPAFIDEIRRTRPDLVYTWGTSVTLGVVGAYDAIDPSQQITDIPVVFTLVAAPVLAKIVPDLKSSRRNVTGVYHVAPTEAQIRAMASYRPIKSIGILYTPTEQNSVVVVDEVQEADRFVERVAGIDVGKAELKVCVRVPGDTPGRRRQEVRTYPARTRAIVGLSDWLRCQGRGSGGDGGDR